MEKRCNTLVDCSLDDSDERECTKVFLTETYNKYASPNTAVTKNGVYSVKKVKKN